MNTAMNIRQGTSRLKLVVGMLLIAPIVWGTATLFFEADPQSVRPPLVALALVWIAAVAATLWVHNLPARLGAVATLALITVWLFSSGRPYEGQTLAEFYWFAVQLFLGAGVAVAVAGLIVRWVLAGFKGSRRDAA